MICCGVLRLGAARVLVHQLGEQLLVEAAPVDADAHRLVVAHRRLDHLRELAVVLVALADVARVDAVLRQRLGAGRDSRSAGGGRCSGSRRSAARRCPCGRAARGCSGTAAAASGVLTVMRTSSEPAIASSLTWIAVPIASTVSVLVIACTRTGASPPIVTTRAPQRTRAWRERRGAGCGRLDEGVGRGEMSLRIDRVSTMARRYFSSRRATLSRVGAELDRLTAKAELRSRRVADPHPKRRLAVDAERFAGLDQARQQALAARVGDLDPRRAPTCSTTGSAPSGAAAPALPRRRRLAGARLAGRRRQ